MLAPPQIIPLDHYNQTLVNNVHPTDWVNPDPDGCYNLVVIGAGTAGLICAAGAAGLGAKVALVEQHLMGGDCLNVGCVPSKALIRASRAVWDAGNSTRFGLQGGDRLSFDFGVAMERMRNLRAELSAHDSARRFRDQLGVDVFIGQGRFVSRECIAVDGKQLFFKKAVVCSGARPDVPPVPGLAESGYLTNETIFSLTELPPRLAVIGTGPVGCELAQVFARFGSRVTLIGHGSRLLGDEEHDASRLLQRVLLREGIELYLEANLQGVGQGETGKMIRLEQHGRSVQLPADQILVATGRRPATDGLDLEQGGIAYDRSGIRVNQRLQSSNRRVYAAGDICSSHKFTHSADALARIVIANALFMGRQKASSLIIPHCTYTDPEIARVGISEQEADQKGIRLTTLTVPLSEIDRCVLDGESEGFASVHLQAGTDRILGATLVARHAGEMINEFSLAMVNGLGLSAIGRTIHPYPTQAEVIKRLADAYQRSRLTPLARRLLAGWLKWGRRP